MNINHNNVPEALGILIEKVDFLTSQLAGLSKTEKLMFVIWTWTI